MAARLFLASFLAALAACGGDVTPAVVEGPIVAIAGEGSDIRSFTVEAERRRYELHVAADVDYGFDLAHLWEHEETGEPVRCRVEDRDGRLYALTIDDA